MIIPHTASLPSNRLKIQFHGPELDGKNRKVAIFAVFVVVAVCFHDAAQDRQAVDPSQHQQRWQ